MTTGRINQVSTVEALLGGGMKSGGTRKRITPRITTPFVDAAQHRQYVYAMCGTKSSML
jgi:hypothetical protein